MNKELRKKVYDFLQKKRSKYELYEQLIDFIIEEKLDSERRIKKAHYMIFTKLSNDINNAGHEEKRSEDIDILNKAMGDITEDEEMEKYLP